MNEDRSGEATSLHAQIQALRQQLHHQAQFIQVCIVGLGVVHSPRSHAAGAAKLEANLLRNSSERILKAGPGAQDLSCKKAEGTAQGDSYRRQLAEAHAANDVLHRQLETLEQEHHQLQRCVVLCDIHWQPSTSWNMLAAIQNPTVSQACMASTG